MPGALTVPCYMRRSARSSAEDEEHKRLFIATRTPAELLALDTRTGRTIARIRCVKDADDVWYDTEQMRAHDREAAEIRVYGIAP